MKRHIKIIFDVEKKDGRIGKRVEIRNISRGELCESIIDLIQVAFEKQGEIRDATDEYIFKPMKKRKGYE